MMFWLLFVKVFWLCELGVGCFLMCSVICLIRNKDVNNLLFVLRCWNGYWRLLSVVGFYWLSCVMSICVNWFLMVWNWWCFWGGLVGGEFGVDIWMVFLRKFIGFWIMSWYWLRNFDMRFIFWLYGIWCVLYGGGVFFVRDVVWLWI